MALQERGDTYHYHFWVAGKRYRGSTKQNNLAAARRVESLLIAEAEQKGEIVLSKRSPLLREFSEKFLDWASNKSGLQQRTKDYYANGWARGPAASWTLLEPLLATLSEPERYWAVGE